MSLTNKQDVLYDVMQSSASAACKSSQCLFIFTHITWLFSKRLELLVRNDRGSPRLVSGLEPKSRDSPSLRSRDGSSLDDRSSGRSKEREVSGGLGNGLDGVRRDGSEQVTGDSGSGRHGC